MTKARDPRADYELSVRLYGEGNTSEAVEPLERAAAGGWPPAMTWLGAQLLSQPGVRPEPRGAELVFAAAEAGHPEALELTAALTAEGLVCPQDWARAVQLLRKAANLGEPRAAGQLRVLGADAAGEVDLAPWFARPKGEILSPDPLIVVFEGLFPQPACDWLIERARGGVAPAPVHHTRQHELTAHDNRSNGLYAFGRLQTDVVVSLMRARIGAIAGLPMDALEPLGVLNYQVGQRFTPHVDAFDTAYPGHAADVARRGQRVATFLGYLNEAFEGGETDFPAVGLRYRGKPGDGVLFRNTDAYGKPDLRTTHAGLAPTSGEKWLLSQFLRDQPQPWNQP